MGIEKLEAIMACRTLTTNQNSCAVTNFIDIIHRLTHAVSQSKFYVPQWHSPYHLHNPFIAVHFQASVPVPCANTITLTPYLKFSSRGRRVWKNSDFITRLAYILRTVSLLSSYPASHQFFLNSGGNSKIVQ